MRYRCFGPFHGLSQSQSDPNKTPFEVDFDTALKWKWRVRFWQIDVAIFDSVGNPSCVGSSFWQWNAYNNPDRATPGFGVAPANEYELPIGWQMNGVVVDLSTGLPIITGLDALFFFAPAIGTLTNAFAAGATFLTPDDPVKPFFSVLAGGCISSVTASSSVTGTFDGIPFDFDDSSAPGSTGTFDMYPLSYWPCAIDSTHAPILDATTGAILLDPHQTDDLPSSS